jgi:hypothetical protein
LPMRHDGRASVKELFRNSNLLFSLCDHVHAVARRLSANSNSGP